MTLNLPTELLRTFVEVIDTGSMLRASERVCVTPSAVSLQVKRLEDICQTALFFRDGRKLSLTPGGTTLSKYAREILKTNDGAIDALIGERAIGAVRIGMVEDFARTLLANTLRRFSALNPEAQVQLRVCGSQELRELIAANRLDIALYMSPSEGEHVEAQREVQWFGDEQLTQREILPLALLEKPCIFREQALQVLDQAGVRYEIVVETGSVSALHAAVDAGLGLTPRIVWTSAKRVQFASLPALPPVGFNAVTSFAPTRAIKALRGLLISSLDDL